jgi:hypothetical protein
MSYNFREIFSHAEFCLFLHVPESVGVRQERAGVNLFSGRIKNNITLK